MWVTNMGTMHDTISAMENRETSMSFATDHHFIKHTEVIPLPLEYALYACEIVDNFEQLLNFNVEVLDIAGWWKHGCVLLHIVYIGTLWCYKY